jgi:hypothetical protein
MRTTVTLDPDVATRLRRLAKDSDISFKEAVNSTLRRGFDAERMPADPYTLPTYDLGLRPGIDLAKAAALAADLEDDNTLAKLELRK